MGTLNSLPVDLTHAPDWMVRLRRQREDGAGAELDEPASQELQQLLDMMGAEMTAAGARTDAAGASNSSDGDMGAAMDAAAARLLSVSATATKGAATVAAATTASATAAAEAGSPTSAAWQEQSEWHRRHANKQAGLVA